MHRIVLSLALILCAARPIAAQQPASKPESQPTPVDPVIVKYLRVGTEKLAARCLTDLTTKDDWSKRRESYRHELVDMLGLDPWPERTPLNATVTGTLDHAAFTVEKLHFQSKPGLYVTANLYVPKNLDKPAPAVLYVCGHSNIKSKEGVPLGNKAGYQHHGAWFARNGYVCLTIDTVQLGEIPGIHHGLYRENMWWWLDTGYTPAGAEAWNCVRALDYLESRKEVDKTRIGVSGRSGGGAYSWWISAIDDRIKVAAPVAGITDLHDHVVAGCVEGHCDCMYVTNTYLWDYPQVAALVAPRPLLLVNTDKDPIFPLDGVMRTHNKVRRVYELLGAGKEFAPTIGEGGHKDTQELQVAVMRWFNRKLKGEDPVIETAATKLFKPEELRVFEPGKEPADAINRRVHESFIPLPKAEVPKSKEQWWGMRDAWMKGLRERVFRAWPDEMPLPADPGASVGKLSSERGVELDWRIVRNDAAAGDAPVELIVKGDWPVSRFSAGDAAVRCTMTPRRIEAEDEKVRRHLLRRFVLLGRTLESTQAWDVRCAIRAARAIAERERRPLHVRATGTTAGIALYAAIFEPGVDELHLTSLPPSHRQGPRFLNVLRVLDTPQAVVMAGDRVKRIVLEDVEDVNDWTYVTESAKTLGWDETRLEIRAKTK